MSTNGVKNEYIHEPGHKLTIYCAAIERSGDGKWSVKLCIKGKVTIDETRSLNVDRNVSVIVQQTGRKNKAKPMTSFNRVLGENIRKQRGMVHMSAAQLGKVAGLSTSFISDLENGKRGISSENLVAIAKAVGCRIEELLGVA